MLPWVLFVGVVMAGRLEQHKASLFVFFCHHDAAAAALQSNCCTSNNRDPPHPDVRNPLVRLVTYRQRIRREDTNLIELSQVLQTAKKLEVEGLLYPTF